MENKTWDNFDDWNVGGISNWINSKKMKEEIKCCMCGKPPEDKVTRQNEKVKIYFVDIKTKETLCEKDNRINDGIYRGNEKRTMGVMKMLK